MPDIKKLYIGGQLIDRLYIGTTEIPKITVGETIVWQVTPRVLKADFREKNTILGWFLGSSYTFQDIPTTAFDFVAKMGPKGSTLTPANIDTSQLAQGQVTVTCPTEISGLKQYTIRLDFKYYQ